MSKENSLKDVDVTFGFATFYVLLCTSYCWNAVDA